MEKKQLLLIEDEGYVINRINEILAKFQEFETVYADNGDTARKILEEKSFDLVITDIYVHGISGLEIVHKAREKNPNVCVIIITGLDNTDLANKALKEGAFDYIIKPPQIDKIENLLKLYLLVKPDNPPISTFNKGGKEGDLKQ